MGDFQSKCVGHHPGGRVGENYGKLTEFCTRVLFLSNNTVYAGSPHTFMYEKDTQWGIWNWQKYGGPHSPLYPEQKSVLLTFFWHDFTVYL